MSRTLTLSAGSVAFLVGDSVSSSLPTAFSSSTTDFSSLTAFFSTFFPPALPSFLPDSLADLFFTTEASVRVEKKRSASESGRKDGRAGGKNVEKNAVKDEKSVVEDEKAVGNEDETESPTKKATEPALSVSVRDIARYGDAVYIAMFGRGLERFDGPGRRTPAS